MTHSADIAQTIAAVWRIEAAKIVAQVARITRDLNLAEDCAQDALLAALQTWSSETVPERPGAWLLTAARRNALDRLRHARLAEPLHERLGQELDLQHAIREADVADAVDAALDDAIGDEVLALIFAACHPLLAPEARAALTLKVVGGLSTVEIARAYLKTEATIAQRIVRAKRTLAQAHVPFELPRGTELTARRASVLEVLYLMFNEGYAASAGPDWMRPALCEEALRLGRVLGGLMPHDAEVHGLVALMEIQASRLAARIDAQGYPILLAEQDRGRWDRLLIRRGLAALEHTQSLDTALGPYGLQAAIAACHARAPTFADTDWLRITALYDALAQVAPSPVVALNRAVAVGMAYGPAEGLALVDALRDTPELAGYHLLPSVRGDLLAKLGEHAAACAEFECAAALARNARERALLQARASDCAAQAGLAMERR
ncbi:MAG: RNA polymerase sigma factor [Acidiferrobacterales bacterium]